MKSTRILDMNDIEHQAQFIVDAAQALGQDKLVILPTETVYGLAANALSETAIQGIFKAKGRPQDNPLIVHIAHLDMLARVVAHTPSEDAERLMRIFWPGPLTLVLPKSNDLAPSVSAGLETVGVRMPDHPITLKVIETANIPIAAPSANRSGRISPTKAEHVIEDMVGRVDLIIKANQSRVGLESTVLDMTQKPYTILRPGAITQEELEAVVGIGQIVLDDTVHLTPKSPGMKYTHYQPKANMVMVRGPRDKVIQHIHHLAKQTQSKGQSYVILCADEQVLDYPDLISLSLGPLSNPAIMAAHLFDTLYHCDQNHVQLIISEAFEEQGIGLALMNRLKKACSEVIDLDDDMNS
jgi:L-threonylcarbamoyladenylate synthase